MENILEVDGTKIMLQESDFPKELNFININKEIEKIGGGWRLPTKIELNEIFLNKKLIKGINKFDTYWSCEEENDYAWVQNMWKGNFDTLNKKEYKCLIRLVKTI